MAVKRYNGTSWDTVAGLGAQGAAATSSSITTWVKTASGGETSLTGSSDSSTTLAYTPGQEQVFINGVLQVRGSDYTATNGTSVTGLAALTAGDIATVTTVNAFSVTGAVPLSTVTANGDLIVGTSAGAVGRLGIGSTSQVLTVSGGAPTWATPAPSGMTLINRTSYSNVASQTFDNVFSTTYKSYMIVVEKNHAATGSDDFQLIFRYGTTDSTNHYSLVNYYAFNSSTLQQVSVGGGAAMSLSPEAGTSGFPVVMTIMVGNIGSGSNAYPNIYGTGYNNNSSHSLWFGGYAYDNQTYTGFKVKSTSSNITGTIAVYGLASA